MGAGGGKRPDLRVSETRGARQRGVAPFGSFVEAERFRRAYADDIVPARNGPSGSGGQMAR